jgi:DNA sulfur modification protein DndD
MIFEKIILESFATYKGRNEIDLNPSSEDKPIILIGGENGCGKTSMLDAFQLVLFGPTARCSNRGKLSYDVYLQQCINRQTDPEEGAVLELVLRFYLAGELKRYRIRRAWSLKGNKIKERFAAFLLTDDGDKFDSVFSENWIDYVEGIFPSKVAPFFLFDGEKIEQLADFENSGPLIQAAISSLLGLNHVDQLSNDLITLEKKSHKNLATLEEKSALEDIERELEEVDKRIVDLQAEEARLNNLIDRKNSNLEEIELRYRKHGGELYDRRNELELRLEQGHERLSAQEESLRQIAAGVTPLMLVEGLLIDINDQAHKEETAERNKVIIKELENRDDALINLLKGVSLDTERLSKASRFLEEDRLERQKGSEINCYLNMSSDAQTRLNALLCSEFQTLKFELPTKLVQLEETINSVETIERSLAGVPEETTIAAIIRERHYAKEEYDHMRFSLGVVHEDLHKAKYSKEMKSAALKRELEKVAEKRFEGKDQRRLLQYSAKSRRALELFRERVIQKHLDKIETNVLEAFQKLLRKEGLIHNLRIDTETFRLRIFNTDTEEIPSERLSAGERQLLATALLWGICRAAGKPLPTIIDTPLGRLDTSHRTNLVTNYFPHASHQVILLSTNEEIVGKYHEGLKPYISHHYVLSHQESKGGTTIQNGYFANVEGI